MRTIEYKFQELCEEVDMWKQEAEYWESKYKESNKEYNELSNQAIQNSMNTVGSLLTILLNSEQTDNGLLIKQKD